MNKTIAIIGAAPCWEDDLLGLKKIAKDFDVMAIGMDCQYKYYIHYFATYHLDDIATYKKRRMDHGQNTDYKVIAHMNDKRNIIDIIVPYETPSGSSALLGSLAAVNVLGYENVILCGCPLLGSNSQKQSYAQFHRGWEKHISKLHGKVKSMSGWTKDFLGYPIEKYDIASIPELFLNKQGLEIGGLSRIFQDDGALPIYKNIGQLDGCNFSPNTLWEHGLKPGQNYNFYGNKVGRQYICEATELDQQFPNEIYDFVINSNCLEHIANPIKAIQQMIRVAKKDGFILLILPKKEACFDHNRSVTSYSHLLFDFQNNTREDDLSHLDEILELHDLSMDPPAGNIKQFRNRSLDNYKNRGLHHHVFDMNLLTEIFNYCGLQIMSEIDTGAEYVITGRKVM